MCYCAGLHAKCKQELNLCKYDSLIHWRHIYIKNRVGIVLIRETFYLSKIQFTLKYSRVTAVSYWFFSHWPHAVRLTFACRFLCESDVRLTSGLAHLGLYFSSSWWDTYLSAILSVGPQGSKTYSKTVLILALPRCCFSSPYSAYQHFFSMVPLSTCWFYQDK